MIHIDYTQNQFVLRMEQTTEASVSTKVYV